MPDIVLHGWGVNINYWWAHIARPELMRGSMAIRAPRQLSRPSVV